MKTPTDGQSWGDVMEAKGEADEQSPGEHTAPGKRKGPEPAGSASGKGFIHGKGAEARPSRGVLSARLRSLDIIL